MNSSLSYDFDSFEDENIAVAYSDTSKKVSVAIIDKNQKVLKSTQTSLGVHINCPIVINTAKDIFVVYSISQDYRYDWHYDCLSVLNSNLETIKNETNVSYQVISLFVDEKNIYSFANENGYKTIIYDHKLNCLRTIGQHSYPQQAFYLINQITQIAHQDNKLYFLYPDKIDVLNQTTGLLLKSISVKGSKMAVDSKSNLWVLSPTSSKLFSYNLDGDLQDEIELENVPDGLGFYIDQGDQMLFSNKTQKSFLF